ncbi:MAG: transcriptional regulator [Acidobacteriia bacterium]|nr:transcriptional regulator [Terriglobia bacterium]
MKAIKSQFIFAGLFLSCLLCPAGSPAQWRSLGPFGGDVRSLVQDPSEPTRLYLGTADSQIFVSTNDGAHWERMATVAPRSDFIVDHIVMDPAQPGRIYAGVWSVTYNDEGGVFVSTDSGVTWKELAGMRGQSVRALAMAPSNHEILVAGTLQGVFETTDGGQSWKQISPPHHVEIRNVESIAIDPRDPSIIYAGTWHLPWKTTDGGKSWFQIHRGMIEDSDVFAIFIHPTIPDSLLLSACSGIYGTTNGGTLWSKFKGIPPSSRRTRSIVADPGDPKVIYAGTTEGLWKTVDSGAVWTRMTSPSLTVNSIVIDSTNHSRILLATDDSGVLMSTDSGRGFTPLNDGFTSRAVSSVLFDRRTQGNIYLAVLYDYEKGGVFRTENGGISWRQLIDGLTSTDVHTLFQSPTDSSIWAGTSDGAFVLIASTGRWRRADLVVGLQPASSTQARPTSGLSRTLGGVAGFSGDPASGHSFYAATQRGLFVSRDSGVSWKRLAPPARSGSGSAVLALSDGRILYATSAGLFFSRDQGVHWNAIPLEDSPTSIHSLVALPDNEEILLMATERGVYQSIDGGATWMRSGIGLPHSDIADIRFDTHDGVEVYVTESHMGSVYHSPNRGETWDWVKPFPEMGLKCRSILPDPLDPSHVYALFFREGLYSLDVGTFSKLKSSQWGDHPRSSRNVNDQPK